MLTSLLPSSTNLITELAIASAEKGSIASSAGEDFYS